MSNKFHTPVETVGYSGVVVKELAGKPFSKLENLSLTPEVVNLLKVVAVSFTNGKEHDSNTSPDAISAQAAVVLRQISTVHGRSYAVQLSGGPQPAMMDEFENPYLAFSLKGANNKKVVAERCGIEPSGMRYFGLLTHHSLVRMMEASAIIRRAGVPTEVMLLLFQPDEFVLNGELLPLSEFKKKLLAQLPDTATEIKQNGEIRTLNQADCNFLKKKLEAVHFVVMLRAMQVNERFQDFLEAETDEELIEILRPTFAAFNQLYSWEYPEDLFGEAGKCLDPESLQDRATFFFMLLPILLGRSYALMHHHPDTELLHVYATHNNISTLGIPVDLDSVRGEKLGLGDSPVSLERRLQEASGVMELYTALLFELYQMELLVSTKEPDEDLPEGLTTSFIEIMQSRCAAQVMYFLESPRNKLTILNHWLTTDVHFKATMKILCRGDQENIFKHISSALNWRYECELDEQIVLNEYKLLHAPEFNFSQEEGSQSLKEMRLFCLQKVEEDLQKQRGNELANTSAQFSPDLAQFIVELHAELFGEILHELLLAKM